MVSEFFGECIATSQPAKLTVTCPDTDGDGQVTICHIPPGNPDNAHTITVNTSALPAHLTHGDHCGPREGQADVHESSRIKLHPAAQ